MQQFSVLTKQREEFVDITSEVALALSQTGLREGAVLVYSPHTTAGVTINEGADPDVRSDMVTHFAHMVPVNGGESCLGFRHAEGNSDSHIKVSMVNPSQLVPVTGGHLALGTWQKIFFCEFDGPRRRTLWVQALNAV